MRWNHLQTFTLNVSTWTSLISPLIHLISWKELLKESLNLKTFQWLKSDLAVLCLSRLETLKKTLKKLWKNSEKTLKKKLRSDLRLPDDFESIQIELCSKWTRSTVLTWRRNGRGWPPTASELRAWWRSSIRLRTYRTGSIWSDSPTLRSWERNTFWGENWISFV